MRKKYIALLLTTIQAVSFGHYQTVFANDLNTYTTQSIEVDSRTVLNIPIHPQARHLTYEEALDLAVNNNSSLKDLIGSLSYLQDQRNTLNDAIDELHRTSAFTGFGRGNVAQHLISLRELETTIANVPLNTQMITDATDLTLRSHLSTLKGYELDIALLNQNIDLTRMNLNNTELKFSLGMESAANVATARNRLAQLEINSENLQIMLENHRLTLNHFLGLNANDQVYIEYAVQLEPIRVDLERHITRALNTSPTIIMQRQASEQASFAIEQHEMFSRFTINPATGEILSEDTTQSRLTMDSNSTDRALRDARNNTENSIRQTYNRLKQLEENAVLLRLDLEQAQKNYDIAVASYNAGMVTQYEVEQARLGILNAEIAIVKNIDNYNLLLLQFEYPYLA